MNLPEIFIRRPVMTTLVMLGILLFGIMGYRYLPVSDLPTVDFPTILVIAEFPGASPETMATAVATPLERQFSTIAGLDSMNSTNAQGISRITLQFNLDRNIDAAAQDVQAMIGKAARQLPPDMPNPPSYQKVNPADFPILFIALSSPTLPLSMVHEYADTFIAQRISMVSGVAQVQVFGAQKYAVWPRFRSLGLRNMPFVHSLIQGPLLYAELVLTKWPVPSSVEMSICPQELYMELTRPLPLRQVVSLKMQKPIAPLLSLIEKVHRSVWVNWEG